MPWSRKSRGIPLLPLWAIRHVQSLSARTVQLHLYSPYGPYGMYRASVPVQYRYTSTVPMARIACKENQCLYRTAKPLLSLWPVLPVMCLSACTVQLYLYSPYGPYCLYRASLPVQYSYTSTPPMGCTACTERVRKLTQGLCYKVESLHLFPQILKTGNLSVGIIGHFILGVRQLRTDSDSFSPLEYLEKKL